MARRYDDRSTDYPYVGGSGIPPRVPSPGHTTYIPSPARLEYQPPTPFYPPPLHAGNLHVPENSRARPRSLPPPIEYRGDRSRRDRDGNRYDDDDNRNDDRKRRARTPIGKAKQFVDNTFTDSTTGLGVGVLGALVGGLAAHEAADATRGHSGHHQADAHRRNQLLSTVVGAAVGALGANAVEKRLEVNREKTLLKQDKWEQKWGPKGHESMPRPKSGGSGRKDSDWDRPTSRGLDRDADPDARSWRNVEDWVYDDRDRDRRGRSRDTGYRY